VVRLTVDLIGIAGIMELFGISRARADQLTRKPGFPEPAAVVDDRQRVWEKADVLTWARQTGRMSE